MSDRAAGPRREVQQMTRTTTGLPVEGTLPTLDGATGWLGPPR